MDVDILVIESAPPHQQAIKLCLDLRRFFQFPIIIVALQASEQERIALLDTGADDIISIDRGLAELPFRCRMLQRRQARQLARDPDSRYLCAGSLRLDIPRCCLLLPDGISIDLTPKQTRLVALLLSAQGGCVPLSLIDAQVFGGKASRSRSKVATMLRDLEQRSRPYLSKPLIDHVHGHGYRITSP